MPCDLLLEFYIHGTESFDRFSLYQDLCAQVLRLLQEFLRYADCYYIQNFESLDKIKWEFSKPLLLFSFIDTIVVPLPKGSKDKECTG